jgi:hypothetical protein
MKKFLALTLCASTLLISNITAGDFFKHTRKKAQNTFRPISRDGFAYAALWGAVSGIAQGRGYVSPATAQYSALSGGAVVGGIEQRKAFSFNTIWKNLAGVSAAASRACVGLGSQQFVTSLLRRETQNALGLTFLAGLAAHMASHKLDQWQNAADASSRTLPREDS